MICQPAETEEGLQAMIDEFLEENKIIEKARYEIDAAMTEPTDNFRIVISFIHPTRKWPVGRFLYENESFSMYTGMCIAGVSIDNLNSEDIQYDFLLGNLDKR